MEFEALCSMLKYRMLHEDLLRRIVLLEAENIQLHQHLSKVPFFTHIFKQTIIPFRNLLNFGIYLSKFVPSHLHRLVPSIVKNEVIFFKNEKLLNKNILEMPNRTYTVSCYIEGEIIVLNLWLHLSIFHERMGRGGHESTVCYIC